MKKQITLLTTCLVGFLLLTFNPAKAAVYYTCVGTSLSLTPSLPSGTTALWDVQLNGVSIAGFPSTTAPTSFANPGTYSVILMAQSSAGAGSCSSDPETSTVYALPAFTLAITSPTSAYCENNASIATLTANLTRTNATGYTLPGGVVYDYLWYKAIDATGNNIGSNPSIPPTTTTGDASTYDLPAVTTAGDVYYTAKATYNISGATVPGTLLGTGCPNFAAASYHLKVNPKPTKPTFVITAP